MNRIRRPILTTNEWGEILTTEDKAERNISSNWDERQGLARSIQWGLLGEVGLLHQWPHRTITEEMGEPKANRKSGDPEGDTQAISGLHIPEAAPEGGMIGEIPSVS